MTTKGSRNIAEVTAKPNQVKNLVSDGLKNLKVDPQKSLEADIGAATEGKSQSQPIKGGWSQEGQKDQNMVRCGEGSEDQGRIGDTQFRQNWRRIRDNRFGLDV